IEQSKQDRAPSKEPGWRNAVAEATEQHAADQPADCLGAEQRPKGEFVAVEDARGKWDKQCRQQPLANAGDGEEREDQTGYLLPAHNVQSGEPLRLRPLSGLAVTSSSAGTTEGR